MGKGQILSGGENGQYTVQLLYNREKALAALDRINRWITSKEEQIAAVPSGDPQHKLPGLKLALASLQKQKEYIESIPADPTVSAWCADLTENLTGEVGTIEIAAGTDAVLVRPGYEGRSDYDSDRDGQMQHFKAMTPEQWFYNAAMAPGWKKWMPTYRVGTLSALNNDKCTVTLDAATTPIYRGGSVSIDVAQVLTDVDIEYMSCNGAAFEDGDRVVVEFRDRSASGTETPVVIGFESEPKPCANDLIILGDYNGKKYVVFWDCIENKYSKGVFWTKTAYSKDRYYLTEDDYPFLLSDAGIYMFSQWMQTRQRTDNQMFGAFTYPAFSGDDNFEPVLDYAVVDLESPSGKIFRSPETYVMLEQSKDYYVMPSYRAEYFLDRNAEFYFEDPEINYTEFTRAGTCYEKVDFEPYNPYPISEKMDGQWGGLSIDYYNGVPFGPCYHSAWTWGATQKFTFEKTYKTKKIIHHTGSKTDIYGLDYTQNGQEISEAIRIENSGEHQLINVDNYINTGVGPEGDGIYPLTYIRKPPDYWIKKQTHIYSMTGQFCPLGTFDWEFTVEHNYTQESLLVDDTVRNDACFNVYFKMDENYTHSGTCCGLVESGDFVNMELSGDYGPYSKGDIAIYNDKVSVQIYTTRNHERNLLAQCVKRASNTEPFGTTRSSQLEAAIKQLITTVQNEIEETDTPWKKFITITTEGIYSPVIT